MDDVCPAHAVVFTVEKKEKSAGRKVISLPRRRPHVRQNADVQERRGHGVKIPLPSDFSALTPREGTHTTRSPDRHHRP